MEQLSCATLSVSPSLDGLFGEVTLLYSFQSSHLCLCTHTDIHTTEIYTSLNIHFNRTTHANTYTNTPSLLPSPSSALHFCNWPVLSGSIEMLCHIYSCPRGCSAPSLGQECSCIRVILNNTNSHCIITIP